MTSDVLFLDDGILAVDKPAGIRTIPGRDGAVGTSLKESLEAARGEQLWPVHRLDTGTSGVIVFARSAAEHRRLNDSFAAREVKKSYVALVAGIPRSARGTIDAALAPARAGMMRVARPGDPAPLPACTRYSVRWCWSRSAAAPRGMALVEFQPETGRTHQLRVHAAASGWPIAGDPRYGDAGSRASAPRLMLHAAALDLPARGGGRLVITAPLPPEMTAFITALGAPIGRATPL